MAAEESIRRFDHSSSHSMESISVTESTVAYNKSITTLFNLKDFYIFYVETHSPGD